MPHEMLVLYVHSSHDSGDMSTGVFPTISVSVYFGLSAACVGMVRRDCTRHPVSGYCQLV